MSELLTVIPVYNGVHYLRATLESLARQTRRPDRVVVIDDCSTDGTCALVESFEEISCELVRNEKNLGLFPNLNHALEYAEDTEFFHLLLADDCIRPSFLETLVESLAQSSAPSFVYCSYDWIDSTGNVIQVGGKMGGKRSYPIGRSKFIYR
ncbi:glycosyltransferase family 2 protein, partial [bacterium]|nr:glycosyltransferase family 2 protein [bacterium]